MIKTVLKYGTFAGLLMGALMFGTTFLLDKIGYSHAEAIGYTCMVVGYLPIFLGVRKYRDDIDGGSIGFGKATGIAILSALFANLFYVAAWLYIYYNMPEFMAKYSTYVIDQMKLAGKAQKEIDEMVATIQNMKDMYKNPLVNAAITYTEPLLGTVAFSLITGLLTMRKKAKLPLDTNIG